MVVHVNHNNIVNLYGKIISEAKFSHEIYGEKFYEFTLEVSRLSESSDKIQITISERLIEKSKLANDNIVYIEGQFRSYNNVNMQKDSKLVLTVFAKSIEFGEDDKRKKNPNQVFLEGFICKQPIYRTTPFGREITDILLAVNRSYNKSDYIPCISWGRNAKYSQTLQVGSKIRIWGRIQSREYSKKLDTGEDRLKIAYEVSVSRMEVEDA